MSPSNTCGKTQRKPGGSGEAMWYLQVRHYSEFFAVLVHLPSRPLRGRITPPPPGVFSGSHTEFRARRGLSSSGLLSTSASLCAPLVLSVILPSLHLCRQGLSLTPSPGNSGFLLEARDPYTSPKKVAGVGPGPGGRTAKASCTVSPHPHFHEPWPGG